MPHACLCHNECDMPNKNSIMGSLPGTWYALWPMAILKTLNVIFSIWRFWGLGGLSVHPVAHSYLASLTCGIQVDMEAKQRYLIVDMPTEIGLPKFFPCSWVLSCWPNVWQCPDNFEWPTHTHPGYLGRKNIIRIVLKDQVFSRFYKNDAPRCASYLGPRTPGFRRKVCFWSVICLGTHTLAHFLPPGM